MNPFPSPAVTEEQERMKQAEKRLQRRLKRSEATGDRVEQRNFPWQLRDFSGEGAAVHLTTA